MSWVSQPISWKRVTHKKMESTEYSYKHPASMTKSPWATPRASLAPPWLRSSSLMIVWWSPFSWFTTQLRGSRPLQRSTKSRMTCWRRTTLQLKSGTCRNTSGATALLRNSRSCFGTILCVELRTKSNKSSLNKTHWLIQLRLSTFNLLGRPFLCTINYKQ